MFLFGDFFGIKILKIPHMVFLRQSLPQYTQSLIALSFSGRKCSIIGRKDIKDGCVGVDMSGNIVWEGSYI